MTQNGLKTAIAALALAWSGDAAHAQSNKEVSRIGFVALVSPSTTEAWLRAFREDLGRAGYEEGRNLIVEPRFADGKRERLKDHVVELARLKVDVLLAAGEPSLLAAKAHGERIPIVAVGCDRLERLLGSLARPGGNATGFTCISSDLGSKRLGILRSLLPNAKRVALLYSDADNFEAELSEAAEIGQRLGMETRRYPVRSPVDFAPAFKQITNENNDVVYIMASSFANLHRGKFAELALAHKLPAMYGFREFVDAGGLISYGAPLRDGFRRAAYQVSRILKGASPADIPVEQPTRFELVLNLRTARALKLDIPTSLIVQADDLVE